MDAAERGKRAAAEAAAELVPDGIRLGLGTGSTVAHLLPALARRGLDLRCVATSPATELRARELGLEVTTLDELGHLDLAIDGADQVDPDHWLVKGGGGAHTREKIVTAASDRFIVIVDDSKVVEEIGPPIPLEILTFGMRATLARLAPAELRDVPHSPEGNLIADYTGPVDGPGATAAWLSTTPGLVGHGLFPPEMVSEVLVGSADGSVRRV